MPDVDAVNAQILSLLQNDGRMTNTKLSENLGMNTSHPHQCRGAASSKRPKAATTNAEWFSDGLAQDLAK